MPLVLGGEIPVAPFPLSQLIFSERGVGVKSAPELGAAKRTLDTHAPFRIIEEQGKGAGR